MRQLQLRSLSEAEYVTIQQMYWYAPKRRLRQRAEMVLLAYKGHSLKSISSIVDVCYNSVCHYVNAFLKGGFLCLYDAPRSGRKPQLTQSQRQQIETWLELSPRELHYQQSCWTMRLMAHRIKAVYHVTLCLERVRQIVVQAGFSLVRPRHQSRLADPEEVQKAQEELEQLHAQAERGEILLLYQDEMRLNRFPTITRMWVRKGTQYQIPMDDDHDTFWAYAVTNPLSGKVHYRIEPLLNGEGFHRFLVQIRRRYPTKQIVVVVDRAKAHQAKVVSEYITQDSRMRLYQLPSYSPKLNNIERLWKWMRSKVTHIHLFENITEMKQAVQNFFRYVNRVPKVVLRRLAFA